MAVADDCPLAGVQFSLPLIDFLAELKWTPERWGSVLITPDRLLLVWFRALRWLGFSSHYP